MKKEELQDYIFWSYDKTRIENILNTDAKTGLSDTEAQMRLKKNGLNQFGKNKKFSKFRLLLEQFNSPLIFILLFATAATLFLHEWFDAAIIMLAIAVNTALGYYQENKAENALEDLRSYIKDRVRVIRDGNEIEIDAANLVVGDLIHVAGGSRIPADAYLVEFNNLKVNESILTGESLDISKINIILDPETLLPDRKNMLYGGTVVTEGSGLAIITATSNETEIGKIANLVADTKHTKTPLQKAVIKLSWIIAFAISFVVAGVFALGVYRGVDIFEMFVISIAVAVGAIPEALPIGLTAVLSVGVQRLAKKKGIMRNLAAAETLGSTTVIMTDKTGTLTEAKMQLVDILTTESILNGSNDEVEENKSSNGVYNDEQNEILRFASMNTNVLVENPTDDPENWRLHGNALESNIIKFAALNNLDIKTFKKENNFGIVLPFNSKNKFSISEGYVNSIAISGKSKKGRANIVLGAPDILINRSEFSDNEKNILNNKIDKLSYSGNRVLCVGIKFTKVKTDHQFEGEEIQGIHILGFLAFKDPIRQAVPQAIKKMEDYGIRVVMATGDLKGTAVSVGKAIGWEIDEKDALSGEELKNLSDNELLKALDHVRIFARVTPEDKLRIGKLFQRKGKVVAMTGDGVNDAPSLKAVDIGIAVGSGTDVAKDVADLVLLDDNFETIVSAIDEGKLMLKNIRKIFVYLMSNSLDEVILIGGSLIASLALPLNAIQIIWVNFFTGSFPAIAFAFDKEELFENNKVRNDKKILNSEVKFLIIFIGTLNSLLMFGIYWFLMTKTSHPEEMVKTFLFACFASYILFVSLSLRNLEMPIFKYNALSNKVLLLGILFSTTMLLSTIYVPFLQNIFNTVSLSTGWLFLIILWVVLNMLMVEISKWIFKTRIFKKIPLN